MNDDAVNMDLKKNESTLKSSPEILMMTVALTSETSPTRGWMMSAQVRAARLLRPELRVLETQSV